jgi:hypothetical protein
MVVREFVVLMHHTIRYELSSFQRSFLYHIGIGCAQPLFPLSQLMAFPLVGGGIPDEFYPFGPMSGDEVVLQGVVKLEVILTWR